MVRGREMDSSSGEEVEVEVELTPEERLYFANVKRAVKKVYETILSEEEEREKRGEGGGMGYGAHMFLRRLSSLHLGDEEEVKRLDDDTARKVLKGLLTLATYPSLLHLLFLLPLLLLLLFFFLLLLSFSFISSDGVPPSPSFITAQCEREYESDE